MAQTPTFTLTLTFTLRSFVTGSNKPTPKDRPCRTLLLHEPHSTPSTLPLHLNVVSPSPFTCWYIYHHPSRSVVEQSHDLKDRFCFPVSLPLPRHSFLPTPTDTFDRVLQQRRQHSFVTPNILVNWPGRQFTRSVFLD